VTEFRLAILSPDREFYSGPAESVTAPGQDGEFGVLAKHIPMIAGLKAGAVMVRAPGGKILYFAVDGGVLGVDPQGVRILIGRAVACDTPERAHLALATLVREK
jgi:F-type H+-transporting ATPase subunit epsilon